MKQNLLTSVWRCGMSALLVLSSLSSTAQMQESAAFWEAGVTVGPSNFLGDLEG
jgi:hypothetical protein